MVSNDFIAAFIKALELVLHALTALIALLRALPA